jgi:aminomethyltransferase
MLNDEGGMIDDLIVYLMPWGYRLVTNAGTREKMQPYLREVSQGFNVTQDERTDFAMLAVQGPHAISKVSELKPAWRDAINALKLFQGVECDGFFIARTGYTGEDGLEIMVPSAQAVAFWNLLMTQVKPCGLAARDTLRLEAGMNLYGQDMDEKILPFECGLTWAVDWTDKSRDFTGKAALIAKEPAVRFKQVGLVLEDKGILRQGYVVKVEGADDGVITSGTFSPTLKVSIAMARVPLAASDKAFVDIRGVLSASRVVALPFVKKGKILV